MHSALSAKLKHQNAFQYNPGTDRGGWNAVKN